MLKHPKFRSTVYFALAVAAIGAATGGCIDIHRNVSRTQTGAYVDEEAFAKITLGKTTAAWASTTMGEPSSKKKTDAGTEIWTWSYSECKNVDGRFLFISDKSIITTYRTASLQIRDGVVIDKWLSSRELKNKEDGSL
jgi:hypothetical protein